MSSVPPARIIIKPFPVLIACQGCAEGGQSARDVARLLDQRGLAECGWLGAIAGLYGLRLKANSRFPIYCLDGCGKGCARAWVMEGGTPQRCFVLSESERAQTEHAADRIAAEL